MPKESERNDERNDDRQRHGAAPTLILVVRCIVNLHTTLPLAQSMSLAYRQLEFRVFPRRRAIDARSHFQMACRIFGRLFVDVSRAHEVINHV